MATTNKCWMMLASLTLAIAACTGTGQRGTRSSRETLTYNGLDRSYLVVEPITDGTGPMGLILALHGGGGTARSMCAMPGGLAEPARRSGYILVCPEGFDRHWNDGRDIETWQAHARGIDDVGFLTALIEHLTQQYPIDSEAIFASGISNGGQMSYRLACEKSEIIRAIAPVVASMATSLKCIPNSPVSVVVVNGTEDPLVPYDGGEIRALRRGLGSVHPTPRVLQFWAAHNGCDRNADAESLAENDPDDGTRILRYQYQNCAGDSQVILYEVIGGGHTWPGANQYLPQFLIGRLSTEMQASEVIVEFFEEFRTTVVVD